jgi:hypothetical protein
MSTHDPEVLYLILTKVAAKEHFYGFQALQGTILKRELAEVYERITGNRVGTRLNWDPHLTQLNALLSKCGLPALGAVVEPTQPAELPKVHATKWPAFSALKDLYSKRKA